MESSTENAVSRVEADVGELVPYCGCVKHVDLQSFVGDTQGGEKSLCLFESNIARSFRTIRCLHFNAEIEEVNLVVVGE